MAGPAVTAGAENQAEVAAYVAVRMLLERRLGWAPLTDDVPTAIEGEVGGPGDDFRISFDLRRDPLEAQCKRSLAGRAAVKTALEEMIRRSHPNDSRELVLVVGSGSSAEVRDTFAADVRNFRQGQRERLRPITKALIAELPAAETILSRLYVVTLDVDTESDIGAQFAIDGLRQALTDPKKAEKAWDVLVRNALKLARGGRWDRNGVEALLRSKGFQLRPVGPDAGWLEQIAQARTLITRFRPRTAAGVLDHLAKELEGKAVQPDVRRQLHGVRGSTALALGDTTKAREQFARALDFVAKPAAGKPRSDDLKKWNDARHNYGLTLYLLEDEKAADEIASEITASDSRHAAGWALFALTRDGQGLNPPTDIENSPEYRGALARLAVHRGDWQAAAEILSPLVATGDAHPTRSNDFAHALLNLSTQLQQGAERTRVLEQSERAVTDVIRALDDAEMDGELGRAYFIRARAREALGRKLDAVEDYERASKLSPEDPNVMIRAASMRRNDGDVNGALAILSEGAAESAPIIRIMRAELLAETGDKATAVSEVTKALDEMPAISTATSSDAHLQAAVVALHAGEVDLAHRALESMRAGGFGNDTPDAGVLLGRIAIERQDWTLAEKEFRAAAALGKGRERDEILGEFATALAVGARYDAALSMFAEANAMTPDHPAFRNYVTALMKAGRFEEIPKLTSSLEETAIARGEALSSLPSILIDAATDVAWKREDFREAARLLEARISQAGSLAVASIGSLLPAADAHATSGNSSRSVELIDAVLARATSPEDQMRAANVLMKVGAHDRAMKVAFKAVRARPADRQMVGSFMSVFIAPTLAGKERDSSEEGRSKKTAKHSESIPSAESFAAETEAEKDDGAGDEDIGADGRVGTVAPECFVRVVSDDGQRFDYFIYKDPPVSAQLHEYVADDPAVKDLIGRRTGEIVVRNAGTWYEQRLLIARVLPAIVVVFRRYLRTFAAMFPEKPMFRAFRIGDKPTIESFGPVLAVIHGSNARREEILARYDELALPLGTVAHVLGRSVHETAQFISSDGAKVRRLKTEGLPYIDYSASVQSTIAARRIVVTRPALTFLDDLGLWKTVADRFELIVAQSTIDEWNEEVSELTATAERGRTLMSEVGGRPSVTEIPPGAAAGLLHKSRDLLTRVTSTARILHRPASALTQEDNKWRELIGASSFDSMALARAEDATLYADDLGLRAVARQEYKVVSFSTIALLEALHSEGRITSDAFERGIIALVERNHDLIPIRAATICAAFEGSVDPRTGDRVLARLSDARVDSTSAAVVAAGALRLIATAGITTTSLESAAMRIALALVEHRDPADVIPTYASLLRDAFKLLPRDLDRILEATSKALNQRRMVRNSAEP